MFKPLMQGMFNAMSVNRKLREIWAAIDEIKEFQEPEAVKEEPKETATEDTAQTVTFDVATCDDKQALKNWAMDTHALKITGNKSADTIRAEIKEYLKQED